MRKIAGWMMMLTTICLAWATAAPAQVEGVIPPFPDNAGPEIWIDGPDNVQPTDAPGQSDVAVGNDGTRIHVWTGFDVIDRDDIYLRRFDASGNPLEDPKRVNTTITENQRMPRVAVSSDGSFLVIFQNNEPSQGGNFSVRSQAYNANGDPVGIEQLLNTVATGATVTNYADVAALRTSDGSPGGYAVAWRNGQFTPEWGDINVNLVTAAGVPTGEFNVHDNDIGVERYSSVTELQNGGFLVVWVNTGTQEVWGRQFTSAGGPVGPEFEITTADNAAAISHTDAAIGWNGNLLVVWEDTGSETPPLPPDTNTEIRGRMFDAELNPLGPDFRINNLVDGIQDDPRIADFGRVGFLVIWSSDTVSAGPDTTQSIEGRVVSGPNAFDATGDGIDNNQVQFNVWDNDSGQNFPGAHGWYGRLSANWQSNTWDGEPEPDTINQLFEIGRDIEYCMFCDDFEWYSPASPGSLWRWDATAGVVP